MYKRLQHLKYDSGSNIIMSKCFGHKTNFPHTHRHFRLAIDISWISPSFAGVSSSKGAT